MHVVTHPQVRDSILHPDPPYPAKSYTFVFQEIEVKNGELIHYSGTQPLAVVN